MGEFAFERMTYRWRKMAPSQREEVLEDRKRRDVPWHSPPHYSNDSGLYMITAACFEHQPIIGYSVERMAEFERELIDMMQRVCRAVFAWNVLPNHYHTLVHTQDVKTLLRGLGRLHGRTSFQWNGSENCRGRNTWFNAAETAMKSERHFWASLNYVLHNAVHHGYADRWQDWPYSNAAQYLADVGREEAMRRWYEYPVLDYGKDWDPPER